MSAIVNVSTAIPLLVLDANGAGKPGQTVTSHARLVGSATTVTATITERTAGEYDAAFVPTSTGTWRVISTATVDGDPFVDTTDVEVVTAAQFDPAASLSGATVELISPLSTDGGTLRLIQGDSYAAAQSRQPTWNLVAAPDLSAAIVTLTITCGATISEPCSVLNPASGSPSVSAVLTKEQTATLDPGHVGVFDLSATIGVDEVTLQRGQVFVKADV